MDYCLERERARIRNIISKLSSNSSPPVSMIKQSTNKLTKQKKVFGYEIDAFKEVGIAETSLAILTERDKERAREAKKDASSSVIRQMRNSAQHIFTFHNMKEALSMSIDFRKPPNFSNRSAGQSFEVPFYNPGSDVFSSFANDDKKLTKFLPKLKNKKNPHNMSPTFLKIISRSTIPKSFEAHYLSKSPELAVKKNLSIYQENRRSKQETYTKKPVFQDNKYKSISVKSKKLSLEPAESKSKMVNIIIPKKKPIMNDNKNNTGNFLLDEDMTLKGWDKVALSSMFDIN
ncbi:hypothetical protein SteCoe_16613 [Stentor coeruleus]|uniref:Uncharacterized protein n=1 Tax=Stentor coeruleus TaxID=5963 RepID=A0A1R2C0T3_9CILI|nr:hypothetical protein SteCoe_16613 [Stentor coeruleus]